MPDDRVQQLAIELTRFKVQMESASCSIDAIWEEMKDVKECVQAFQVEAARMTAAAQNTAVAAQNTATILERHTEEDMEIAKETKAELNAINKTLWRLGGALAVVVVLVNLFAPKFLALLK